MLVPVPSQPPALPPPQPLPSLPSGFHRLIAAQFCSALADNALLIVAIALLQQQHMALWWAPMLKVGFTLSYVLLAPWVGPLADAVPKARLMAWMNGVKLLGAVALLAGVHPVAGFALVGLGAAAYAPAKYGLVTELVPARQLVAANGWIEVSVVSAVLLGAGLGGLLVSAWWLDGVLPAGLAWLAGVLHQAGLVSAAAALRARQAWGGAALQGSVLWLLAVYAAAAWLNRGLPDSGARYPAAGHHPLRLLRGFGADLVRLWADRHGGALSLAATTLFWGAGATLQFVVLRWAHEQLGLPLSQAAVLQAVVAVGVVLGAVLAGHWVPLSRAAQMLGFGVLLGLSLPLLALVHSLWLAVPLLVGAGALGGLMVVPLNALLQHRGCQLLSAGRSIAVQGFNENLSILLMLAAYAAAVHQAVPLPVVMVVFGLLVALPILGLMAWLRRQPALKPTSG